MLGKRIKRNTAWLCITLTALMGAGRAMAGQPVPFSAAETSELRDMEKERAPEVLELQVGDGGSDPLAIVGGVFLVLIIIAAIAGSNSDSEE